jgi:hypothetical protein
MTEIRSLTITVYNSTILPCSPIFTLNPLLFTKTPLARTYIASPRIPRPLLGIHQQGYPKDLRIERQRYLCDEGLEEGLGGQGWEGGDGGCFR